VGHNLRFCRVIEHPVPTR